MFSIGDIILYGNEGICEIADIVDKSFGDIKGDYYVLRPISNYKLTLYVSVANGNLESKVRDIFTKEQIANVIQEVVQSDIEWIESESQRKAKFKEMIFSGDRYACLSVIKALYKHREMKKAVNKKLHTADEYILKDAEKILYDEFAYVLNLPVDQVEQLIMSKFF